VVKQESISYIDLSKSLDELWLETRPNHRRDNHDGCFRTGYSVDMDDWSAYPAFRLVYRMTSASTIGKGWHTTSPTLISKTAREVRRSSPPLHRARTRGEVAAAGLFMSANDIVDYPFGWNGSTVSAARAIKADV
jgi:hypothetical protein